MDKWDNWAFHMDGKMIEFQTGFDPTNFEDDEDWEIISQSDDHAVVLRQNMDERERRSSTQVIIWFLKKKE